MRTFVRVVREAETQNETFPTTMNDEAALQDSVNAYKDRQRIRKRDAKRLFVLRGGERKYLRFYGVWVVGLKRR